MGTSFHLAEESAGIQDRFGKYLKFRSGHEVTVPLMALTLIDQAAFHEYRVCVLQPPEIQDTG